MHYQRFQSAGRRWLLNQRGHLNLYPFYLALCILGASAANGNEIVFLTVTAGLFSSFLICLRQRRFRSITTNGLLALALVAGLIGGHHLQQLQGHVEDATAPLLTELNGYAVDPYQSVTQVGNMTSLKQSHEILFRVAPASPSEKGRSPLFPLKLRDASYNTYRAGTWGAIGNQFVPVFPANESLSQWSLIGNPSPAASIQISDTLRNRTGILKLPMGTSEVHQLDADLLEQNPFGAVKVHGRSGPLTYAVKFAPQDSFDSLPTPQDIEVPEIEQPALQSVLQDLKLQQQPDQDKIATLQTFFEQNFQYSLELTQPKSGQTGLSTFLLDHRSGHCEYFASATALLLREAGIPTRYVVGYSAYEYSPLEQQYVVRRRNAHAWVIAYVNGQWREVDTTPPDWTTVDDTQANLWQAVGDLMAYLGFQFSQIVQQFNPLTLLMLPIPLLAFILWKKRRESDQDKPMPAKFETAERKPGIDSEFYQVEVQLQALSLQRQADESLAMWLDRLQPQLSNPQQQQLSQIMHFHYRYRFDPDGLTDAERQQLQSFCLKFLESLKTMTETNGKVVSRS